MLEIANKELYYKFAVLTFLLDAKNTFNILSGTPTTATQQYRQKKEYRSGLAQAHTPYSHPAHHHYDPTPSASHVPAQAYPAAS
jgi:hypothetical protein